MIRGVTQSVENKDLEILKYLTQYLTISQIAKLRKSSRTVIYRSVNRLINKGLLRKIGKGYDVTEIGLQHLHKSLSGLLRLHNLAFKISIISKPHNWELKRSKIIDCRAFMREITLNHNTQQLISIGNIKVKTTSNSMIFYMPTFYGNDTDDCFKQALDSLWNIIPKIENLLKIILIKDRKCNIEIISQHYAKLNDSLAKLYKTENNKLYVKDELGNTWLIADYSFRVNELETIYNKSAKEDMDSVKDFLNDLRKNPATISQLTNLIQGVTANQVVFDKNMKSHLKILNKLGKAVENLTCAIKKQNIRENYKEDQTTLNKWH